MSSHVCPWYIGYFLASPLRRLFQNPEKIFHEYFDKGMSILEIGPGYGLFYNTAGGDDGEFRKSLFS